MLDSKHASCLPVSFGENNFKSHQQRLCEIGLTYIDLCSKIYQLTIVGLPYTRLQQAQKSSKLDVMMPRSIRVMIIHLYLQQQKQHYSRGFLKSGDVNIAGKNVSHRTATHL